ncbi:MAG: small subunit ribosomal protein [Candidatus Eremiobacteraeota bacterium]|jgi:small subunit ribosomal protein S17|nr:small subunit ribosomal protein [Candidatus Eremiobacteraeota bacterium]
MEQPDTTATATVDPTPSAPATRGNRRRVKQGRVKSDKMDKTIVVVTETRVPHPVYKKVVRQSTRFKAHDERNEAKAGDLVRIQECRPMSRDKRWHLVEILERAK